jgi:hypothetical protein
MVLPQIENDRISMCNKPHRCLYSCTTELGISEFIKPHIPNVARKDFDLPEATVVSQHSFTEANLSLWIGLARRIGYHLERRIPNYKMFIVTHGSQVFCQLRRKKVAVCKVLIVSFLFPLDDGFGHLLSTICIDVRLVQLHSDALNH